MDIDPIHLLFPEQMPPDGQDFIRAHGMDTTTLKELQTGAVLLPGGQVKIHHVCQQLDEMGLCRIYADRPVICRNCVCNDEKCPPVKGTLYE